MILIADSGSTKTQWCIADQQNVLKEIFTGGINPYHQSEESIRTLIEEELNPVLSEFEIKSIFYYGAGCGLDEKKELVNQLISSCFENIDVVVESDLFGAARALFADKPGIACILGTGSNSCFYDGKQIVDNVSSLGYILGDEGSGAVLGKRLVADCLKNQLPSEIKEKFLDQFNLSVSTVLENVYKKPLANRYLASLSVFLHENLDNSAIYNLVYDELNKFFKRDIMQYPYKEYEVGFVGSIAYYYSDILREIAKENDIVISDIIRQPMDGLIPFHTA